MREMDLCIQMGLCLCGCCVHAEDKKSVTESVRGVLYVLIYVCTSVRERERTTNGSRTTILGGFFWGENGILRGSLEF